MLTGLHKELTGRQQIHLLAAGLKSASKVGIEIDVATWRQITKDREIRVNDIDKAGCLCLQSILGAWREERQCRIQSCDASHAAIEVAANASSYVCTQAVPNDMHCLVGDIVPRQKLLQLLSQHHSNLTHCTSRTRIIQIGSWCPISHEHIRITLRLVGCKRCRDTDTEWMQLLLLQVEGFSLPLRSGMMEL